MSQHEAQREATRIKRTIDNLPITASASVLSVWAYKLRRVQQYL